RAKLRKGTVGEMAVGEPGRFHQAEEDGNRLRLRLAAGDEEAQLRPFAMKASEHLDPVLVAPVLSRAAAAGMEGDRRWEIRFGRARTGKNKASVFEKKAEGFEWFGELHRRRNVGR